MYDCSLFLIFESLHCKKGLRFLPVVRLYKTSKSALSQIVNAFSLAIARVCSATNAPPPEAKTQGEPESKRFIIRSSPARYSSCPKHLKTSITESPAAFSISWSPSTNGRLSFLASLLPTLVLPLPIKPTSKIILLGFIILYSLVFILTLQ